MPICQGCQEEVDEVTAYKVGSKKKKLCEDCIEIAEEEAEIAGGALSAMQDMMEYKGR